MMTNSLFGPVCMYLHPIYQSVIDKAKMFRRSSSKGNASDAPVMQPLVRREVVSAPAPATASVTPVRSHPVPTETGRCPHHRNKVSI